MNISVRDVGDAKVVKVEGDVDLGTSKDLRRTLFETLPRAAKLALNLEAIRYIVLNPVRAGLCRSPADWPWSSYHACAGTELAHPFLSVDRVLGLFGTRPAAARAAFRAFVREGHVQVSDTRL